MNSIRHSVLLHYSSDSDSCSQVPPCTISYDCQFDWGGGTLWTAIDSDYLAITIYYCFIYIPAIFKCAREWEPRSLPVVNRENGDLESSAPRGEVVSVMNGRHCDKA